MTRQRMENFSMLRHLNIIVMVLLLLPHVRAFIKDSSDISSSANVNDKLHNEKVIEMMTKILLKLDAFDVHYHTKLEDKFVNIIQLLSHLDANIKQLQEKAQVWDIFRHHITSWSDNIKSSDQKIEILRKAMESLPVIENQLQNTDFKVQHVFDKVDVMNEKLHEVSKALIEIQQTQRVKQQSPQQKPSPVLKSRPSWSQEDFEQTEILMRLSKIQRTLQSTCSSMRLGREIEEIKDSSSETDSGDTVASLKALMTKVNNNLEKLPIKELKQTHNHCKKQEKSVENLLGVVNQIDERTIRIFDANSFQFKKTLSSCKSSEHEILTFTTNADTLLKRVETSLKSLDASNFNEKCLSSRKSSSDSENDGSAGGELDDEDETAEYIQPRKTNCFQLTTGRSGVYTFKTERRLNEKGRDFHRQYCEYSTEGTAWTIIQKRDNFNPPENFNRSWSDYKSGFGDLSRDFWFGNDFIHELTRDQDMVLRIVLEDFRDNHVWVEYGIFRIDSETTNYKLRVDEYRGSIADSFLHHNNSSFSTFDRRNDRSNATISCAQRMGAGWWFIDCAESNLNGIYHDEPLGKHSRKYKGIFWEHWLGDYSLKASKMMIRPKDVWYSQPLDDDLIEIQNDDLMLTGRH